MAWLKVSDTAGFGPKVAHVAARDDCDDRLVNEVLGFVLRCALQSAQAMTNSIISKGMALQAASMCRGRARYLLDVAVDAEMMEWVTVDARVEAKVADDEDGFMHIRTREEIEWERQQRRDNSNPALTVPVKLRDGDACRWCGVVVSWRTRRSARGATYDHLNPGKGADIETMVVACNHCNSSRKDGTRPRRIADLLPAPTTPYFSASTVEWLEHNPWRRDKGLAVPTPTSPQVVAGRMPDGSQPPSILVPELDGSQPPSAPESTSAESAPAQRRVPRGDVPAGGMDADHQSPPSPAPSPAVLAPAECRVPRDVDSEVPGPPGRAGSQPAAHTPAAASDSVPAPAQCRVPRDVADTGGMAADHQSPPSPAAGPPGNASPPSPPQPSDLRKHGSADSLQKSVNAQGTGVNRAGRVGSGRVGSSPPQGAPPHPHGSAPSRRTRRRGGRGRRTRIDE